MINTRINEVRAWEALDSRGTPTVACEVRLRGGGSGTALVPSGASTGTHEAAELRDGDERYGGRGVRRAVGNVERELAPAVSGIDAVDQYAVDTALRERDGTANLARLGANAVLAVSIGAAAAAADGIDEPLYRLVGGSAGPLLPLPMVNIVSGGAHAGWTMNLQDVLVVPFDALSFAQALEWAWNVRCTAAELTSQRKLNATLVADEGGLGPALETGQAAVDLVATAIAHAGLEGHAGIAIDIAATQLHDSVSGYRFGVNAEASTAEQIVAELARWTKEYPIVSLEDPLAEDDWDGWSIASTTFNNVQLLGDDLFATNSARLERGITRRVANAVLVKPNQNGTLSGTRDVVDNARHCGYATVLSARSGDTEDAWLADLAIGWRTGQIKVGSTMRSERTAKWNRLLAVEAALGADAEFAGARALAGAS